jgi:hypothetical protein
VVGILVSDPRTQRSFETDFETLINVVKGTAIVSMAESDDYIELGLSENLQIRIEVNKSTYTNVFLYSTLNEGELSPVRLQLVTSDEDPLASEIAIRIHSLRQTYAIYYLLYAGRGEELAKFLDVRPRGDIERELLAGEDWLQLQAAGPGSFDVTAIVKAVSEHGKAAAAAALFILGLVYSQGRTAMLEYIRAAVDSKQESVEALRLDNEHKRRMNVIAEELERAKIKDPAAQARIQERLDSFVQGTSPKIARQEFIGSPGSPAATV